VAGEASVAQHPVDVEVLDHDGAVLADQACGELVQAVAAGVRHGGVQSGDAGLGATPPLRRRPSRAPVGAVSTRGLPLQAPQLAFGG
jgi:hypothetical protein